MEVYGGGTHVQFHSVNTRWLPCNSNRHQRDSQQVGIAELRRLRGPARRRGLLLLLGGWWGRVGCGCTPTIPRIGYRHYRAVHKLLRLPPSCDAEECLHTVVGAVVARARCVARWMAGPAALAVTVYRCWTALPSCSLLSVDSWFEHVHQSQQSILRAR